MLRSKCYFPHVDLEVAFLVLGDLGKQSEKFMGHQQVEMFSLLPGRAENRLPAKHRSNG